MQVKQKYPTLKPLVVALAMTLITYSAYAVTDVAPSESNIATMDAITISGVIDRPELAPNSPLNAYRVPESSNNHTQTISREEIEQLRPTDAFELLNSSTGVIATSGSRKGFKGLSIRGDANFIWIIDGAYLQSTMASRMMNTLPIGAIEEVKIVRGGSALTMGPEIVNLVVA